MTRTLNYLEVNTTTRTKTKLMTKTRIMKISTKKTKKTIRPIEIWQLPRFLIPKERQSNLCRLGSIFHHTLEGARICDTACKNIVSQKPAYPNRIDHC